MNRRQFLGWSASAVAASGQKKQEEAVTATATQDRTPRVGIVLSSFRGSSDHDGTSIPGLADPQPTDAELTEAQIDAMVRKAVELGNTRQGDLSSIIGPEDWVVIKPNIVSCYGLGPEVRDGGSHTAYVPGMVTDLRIVRSLMTWMAEHHCGARITVAEGSGEWLPREKSKSPVDGWTTDWGGAFGGWSYVKLIGDLARRFPKVRFDRIDLNFDEAIELPVQGRTLARNNLDGLYTIAKTIQACDRFISLSPLKVNPATGVSLAMKNYFGIAPAAKYGFPKKGLHTLGDPNDVLVDLFGFRPADYALIGGSWGLEGNLDTSVRHNLLIAGTNAVAVDAVGAALMGFQPAKLKFLENAWKRGYGTYDVDEIWMRGNSLEEARRNFRKAGV